MQVNKAEYKFEVDGIGVQFETAYRSKLDTGIQYQVKKLLGFWHSKKDHAYVVIYKRDHEGTFGFRPFQVAKVLKDGSYTMMTEAEWDKDRKK